MGCGPRPVSEIPGRPWRPSASSSASTHKPAVSVVDGRQATPDHVPGRPFASKAGPWLRLGRLVLAPLAAAITPTSRGASPRRAPGRIPLAASDMTTRPLGTAAAKVVVHALNWQLQHRTLLVEGMAEPDAPPVDDPALIATTEAA